MKLPLSWLHDWVQIPAAWEPQELARRLTFAGFEVEALSPAAPEFIGVVVGRIATAQPHPGADKLQVCQVVVDPVAGSAPGNADATAPPALSIVCGASNARPGLVTAVALVGAQLPGEVRIREAKLRGVSSSGMLCSARELGLADTSEGIIELPADAPVGTDLRRYLGLPDSVLEINVTPNRGDAMSVLGIAREVAALAGTAWSSPTLPAANAAQGSASIPVQLTPGTGAARFLSCIVEGVDNTRQSPVWLRERLRRAGVRSISPVVDVTNYVMLELGTPMHAYDGERVHGGLAARWARANEALVLLDGREVQLAPDVLVIADDSGAVGMAGIFGGERTAITSASRRIVLEAAWFAPASIAGRARRYGLMTDAGQRFERGVDYRAQERAMNRALQLLALVAGGTQGAISCTEQPQELPPLPSVGLRRSQLRRLLGIDVAGDVVEQRLRALGMQVESGADGWRVQPPSWRFDIAIEADLIEEVARLGGLDQIQEQAAAVPLSVRPLAAGLVDERVVMRTLVARGYQEAITFGFVNPVLQRQLFAAEQIELANPIAADLAVMRRSLWPGLISAARENSRRQQSRVWLFEIATRFLPTDEPAVNEQKVVSGIALGTRLPEQWGVNAAAVDFFDIKADVEALLALAGGARGEFVPATLACLHPGRSARVLRADGVELGYIGELHPELVRELGLPNTALLFELEFDACFAYNTSKFKELSRFPQVRRDLSVSVPKSVSFAAVRERASVAGTSLLREIRLFDLYQGDEVESNRKSIALGLILQDLGRTLKDEDADQVVAAVLRDLQSNLDAKLRE